jgi:hypothetical protein
MKTSDGVWFPAACVALVVVSSAMGDGFDDAIAIVPGNAPWAIVVPSLSKAAVDLGECLASMDRKEGAIVGRPMDHLRAFLEAREGFDESGSFAAWAGVGTADRPDLLLLIPAADPAAYIAAHPTRAEDGSLLVRGESFYARAFARHLLVSKSKAAVESFATGEPLAKAIEAEFGGEGVAQARAADVAAWIATPDAARAAAAVAPAPMALNDLGAIGSGFTATLVFADIDPLGLSIRTRSKIAEGSSLAQLAARCRTGADAAQRKPLAGLYGGPFLVAGGVDVAALGGRESIIDLASMVSVADRVPSWLTSGETTIGAVRFASYPSKLGVLAGGLLNDAALVIESSSPGKLRDALKEWVLAQEGIANGVRRTPSWEDGRALKDGSTADAFEVKETPLGPSEAQGVDLAEVAAQRMAAQALLGPRGLHGFAKVTPTSLVITFSQRPDVFGRAVAAAGASESLSDDAVIKSMESRLLPGAQVEAYLSVGQLLKAIRQLADMFGGAGGALPNISSKAPPVAWAFRAAPREASMALVVPTPVLSAAIDQVLAGQVAAPKRDRAPE